MSLFSFLDSLCHKVVDHGRFKPNILSNNDTIDLVLEKKLSVARYGDGEFNMMLGKAKDIRFQTASAELSKKLRSVFLHPTPNVLICIPKVFDWKDRLLMNRNARKFWSRYLNKQSSVFFELISGKTYYGNALLSRPYIDYLKTDYHYKRSAQYFSKIKTLWDSKKVLIVEGELTRFGVGNTLLDNALEVKRILCPAENCWSCVSEILKTTLTVSDNFDLVILALGPTATVLANDLAEHNIQALELGHLDIEYEWFLQRASFKSLVKGKYVNEVHGGSNLDEVREDSKFNAEILFRITPISSK